MFYWQFIFSYVGIKYIQALKSGSDNFVCCVSVNLYVYVFLSVSGLNL